MVYCYDVQLVPRFICSRYVLPWKSLFNTLPEYFGYPSGLYPQSPLRPRSCSTGSSRSHPTAGQTPLLHVSFTPRRERRALPTIRRPYKRIPQHIIRGFRVGRLHPQIALPTEHLPDKVAVRHVDDGAALAEAKVDRPLLLPPLAVDAVRARALDPGVELLPDGHHQVLADVRQR